MFTALVSAQVQVTKEGHPKFPKKQAATSIASQDTVLISKVDGIVMGIAYSDFTAGLGGGTALSFTGPLTNSGGTVSINQSQLTAPWAGLTGVPPNIDLNKLDDFSGDYNDLINKPSGNTNLFLNGNQLENDNGTGVDLSPFAPQDITGKQDNITLTTTGTDGPATLTGNTLNVPQYAGEQNLAEVLANGNDAEDEGIKGLSSIKLNPVGSSTRGWELKSNFANDDFVFAGETAPGSGTYATINKINMSGTPLATTDLIDVSYGNTNYFIRKGFGTQTVETSPIFNGTSMSINSYLRVNDAFPTFNKNLVVAKVLEIRDSIGSADFVMRAVEYDQPGETAIGGSISRKENLFSIRNTNSPEIGLDLYNDGHTEMGGLIRLRDLGVGGPALEMVTVDNSGYLSSQAIPSGSDGTGTDDQTAAEVPFIPNGSIAATNVQEAIQEVRDEATGGASFDEAANYEPTGDWTFSNPVTVYSGTFSAQYGDNGMNFYRDGITYIDQRGELGSFYFRTNNSGGNISNRMAIGSSSIQSFLPLDLNDNKLTEVGVGTISTDGVNKGQMDAAIASATTSLSTDQANRIDNIGKVFASNKTANFTYSVEDIRKTSGPEIGQKTRVYNASSTDYTGTLNDIGNIGESIMQYHTGAGRLKTSPGSGVQIFDGGTDVSDKNIYTVQNKDMALVKRAPSVFSLSGTYLVEDAPVGNPELYTTANWLATAPYEADSGTGLNGGGDATIQSSTNAIYTDGSTYAVQVNLPDGASDRLEINLALEPNTTYTVSMSWATALGGSSMSMSAWSGFTDGNPLSGWTPSATSPTTTLTRYTKNFTTNGDATQLMRYYINNVTSQTGYFEGLSIKLAE
ncbi:hypothetical protein LCGC14_0943650 [marine sediment metagenome]